MFEKTKLTKEESKYCIEDIYICEKVLLDLQNKNLKNIILKIYTFVKKYYLMTKTELKYLLMSKKK